MRLASASVLVVVDVPELVMYDLYTSTSYCAAAQNRPGELQQFFDSTKGDFSYPKLYCHENTELCI